MAAMRAVTVALVTLIVGTSAAAAQSTLGTIRGRKAEVWQRGFTEFAMLMILPVIFDIFTRILWFRESSAIRASIAIAPRSPDSSSILG